MIKENLIHVKLEYGEALEAKKDILSSEMGILKISKIMKRYHLLRTDEFRNKMKLLRKMTELKSSISGLQQTLPKIKIPKLLEKEKKPERVGKITEEEYDKYEGDLETQLRKIQEKLREIG